MKGNVIAKYARRVNRAAVHKDAKRIAKHDPRKSKYKKDLRKEVYFFG